MDEILDVWVAGIPKGQPRGRAFVTGGRARVWTPGTAEAWKGDIARAFERHLPEAPIAEPCRLIMEIYFPRPKRLMRKKDPDEAVPCPSLPDWDNAGKAVCDALVHIGVLADDKWIVQAVVSKFHHHKTGRPGALIWITNPGPVEIS